MIKKFVCVHILKTAGTTLRRNFLKPVYKDKCLIEVSFKETNQKRKDGKRKRKLTFENQVYPPDYKNYDVIYGHFKGDKYAHLNWPMFSFVRHPVDRMISHYYHFNKLNIIRGRGPSLIEFSEKWKNHMTYILGDISRYEFIGIVEDFDKSLERMCDILEVDCPINIISRRVSRSYKPEQISNDVRKEIEDMNAKDMELYNEVINKFN